MFYTNIWDPWLILAQIAVLQCIFYIGVGVWLLVFSITFGTSISLHAILAPTQLQMVQGVGWPPIGAFLLVAPIMSGRTSAASAQRQEARHTACCCMGPSFPYSPSLSSSVPPCLQWCGSPSRGWSREAVSGFCGDALPHSLLPLRRISKRHAHQLGVVGNQHRRSEECGRKCEQLVHEHA